MKIHFGNYYNLRFIVLGLLFFIVEVLYAQISIDGYSAYYDSLTDSYLMSVPQDYHADNIPDDINVQYTHLPIIKLEGSFSNDYSNGSMLLSLPDGTTTSYYMKAKYRGGTSNGSDKHKRNFHIKLLDSKGNKLNSPLLGLRNDNNFLLDAGQKDLGRIRNHVANEIWRDMGNQPYYADKQSDAKNYIDCEFVEIFIGEEYFGLYSLTEAIDRKQMQILKYDEDTNEIHGVLYKASTWEYTMLYGPFSEPDNYSEEWGGFELKYPEIDDVCPTDWSPLYNAAVFTAESSEDEFLSGVDQYFDIPVLIDFYIFNNLLGATDHGGKNMYWACYDIQSTPMLTVAIWDYDTIIGQIGNNSEVHSPTYGPEVGDIYTLAAPQVIYRLIKYNDYSHFLDKAIERYQELRKTVFQVNNLTKRFNDYFDMLRQNGTLSREQARWSNDTDIVGLDLDFDDEQAYIEDWLTRRLIYWDEIFGVETNVKSVYMDQNTTNSQRYNLSGQRVNESYKGVVIFKGKKILINK